MTDISEAIINAIDEIKNPFGRPTPPQENLVLEAAEKYAAGFRLPVPVTDAEVRKAYRGFCIARKGQELLEGEYEAVFSRVEFAWIRAALEAARSVTG